jgi:hypothetical protein
MHCLRLVVIVALVVPVLPGRSASSDDPFQPRARLTAETYNSGFTDAHDTYNGMGCASDGRIYYVLSSERHDVGAQMYVFDPGTKAVRHVADLTEACGEKGARTIVQGKSHVNFSEANGKLYFSTHIGFYSIVDGMEKMGIPPPGWKPYPGGHLLAYDLASGKFDDFGCAPAGEGILTTSLDPRRGRLYGLTWPHGYFFRYDLARKEWKNFGLFAEQGEEGRGERYRTLCRSIAVNPDDGSAWFSVATGDLYRYDYAQDKVLAVAGEDLRKDYFGLYDPASAGHMGYNWRQTFYRPEDRMIYGVHGNSGYLFRLDPTRVRVEVLERLTSAVSQRTGMFDQFSYGYLGFALGPDGRTIYYLTGGPIYRDGRRVAGKTSTAMGEAKGVENLHLVTYDIRERRARDHGAIFYPNGDRPLYVNSIAVGRDQVVYFLARITESGRTRTDLVSVRVPR